MFCERLTRHKDNYPCRLKDCYAEDWMNNLYGSYPVTEDCCNACPFMDIVNHLAELEDMFERMDDDRK